MLEVMLQVHCVVITDRARARIFLNHASFRSVCVGKDIARGGKFAVAGLLRNSEALLIVAFIDEDVA